MANIDIQIDNLPIIYPDIETDKEKERERERNADRETTFSISLSFSLSASVSGYIIGNLRVCEQTQSARPVCNNAIEISFFPFNFACIRTSLDSYFFLSLSH